jgi:hypothetical protein
MPAATIVSVKANGPFVGSYTGTTAAQNIYLGFKPAMIEAWNRTDGDVVFMWSKAILTTLVSIDAEAATESIVIAGVEDASGIGFSLPSNAVVNENAKVYDFIAWPE